MLAIAIAGFGVSFFFNKINSFVRLFVTGIVATYMLVLTFIDFSYPTLALAIIFFGLLAKLASKVNSKNKA